MKVYIRDDGNVGYSLANLFQSNGSIVVGYGQTHYLATCAHHLLDLCDGCADVGCVRLCHGLDHDRSSATDLDVFDFYWARLSHNKSDKLKEALIK